MLVNVITRYPVPPPKVLELVVVQNPNAFGAHIITVANRYLQPVAVQNGQVFGSNRVGFAPSVLTQARVDNENAFGDPVIQKLAAGVRHLVPIRVASSNQFGAANVHFATKTLAQIRVANANQFGAQAVAAVQKSFSYSNPLGSGNRTGTITVTTSGGTTFDSPSKLVNGNLTEFAFWGYGAITFKFDLGSAKIIRQARWRQDTSTTHTGLFQWQGSNDDASYADIGGTFNLGGAPITHHDALLGNNTAYRYYRLIPTSGASISGTPYLREVEFYIEGALDGPPD